MTENQRFSDIFRGYRNGILARNGSSEIAKILCKTFFFTLTISSECYLLIPLKTSENQRFFNVFRGRSTKKKR